MAGNQVTDGDSGVDPQTGPVSDEPHVDSSEDAAAKDVAGDSVTADAPSKPADSPKKVDKSKLKGKDEPQARAQKTADVPAADLPASDTKAPDHQPPAPAVPEPQASKPKTLAEVMKVDLRVRRRRRY
ncbi:MAG: hypothetical protein JOY95_10370 [Silvibacterium sp.]|nr:hypothetical protein [Silvibacterium sp.]